MLQVNVGKDEKKYGFLLEDLNEIELKEYKNSSTKQNRSRA